MRAAKVRLAEIKERLAALGTTFSQNVLADEQAYTLAARARGGSRRPARFRARGGPRGAREERGLAGHVVTLSRSSVEPFLQFSARRDLREKAFRAWIARGDGGGKTDNKGHHRGDGGVARRAGAPARLSRLRALPARRRHGEDAGGGARPARNGMAAGARARARPIATPCRRWCRRRAAISRSRHGTGAITPRSCARCVATSTRPRSSPTCSSTSMIEAAFYTAQRLFGLTFAPRDDVPVWHPDVRVVGGARRRRAASRTVLRRLFRARHPSTAAPG